MIIMLTVWFPFHKSKEVGEMFFKATAKGIPKLIKKWLTFSTVDGKNGMKGYHLIYIEKGQVDEALFEINKIMVPFLDWR